MILSLSFSICMLPAACATAARESKKTNARTQKSELVLED